ncbi:MAG TPA: hypothetical protein VMI06_16165, partial [Terriglobia bacterium]|nr:hypothetical protein [Terriglobia bacterium]
WSKPNPNLHGWTKGIVPTARWIHFTLSSGSGLAILDRGLTGREINGRTPIVYLYNATDKYYGYPNPWLSGAGKHRFAYALVAHETSWATARIPQMAWEYNSPPIVLHEGVVSRPASFLKTSGNVILQALRREGKDIELHLVESFGMPGTAEVALSLPHRNAVLTNLRGANPTPLEGGPSYRFPIRPQQIVTMRLTTDVAVEDVKPILRWDPLVPNPKLPALNAYGNYKGHPPRGDQT